MRVLQLPVKDLGLDKEINKVFGEVKTFCKRKSSDRKVDNYKSILKKSAFKNNLEWMEYLL